MISFKLDDRLQADCHRLYESALYTYLLHKNAEVSWFILAPHVEQIEFYQLNPAVQTGVCLEINRMSTFIQSHFDINKINVASIGNVVSQMHIHVIGRRQDDAYWPDVVWGKTFEKTYNRSQIDTITADFQTFFKR